MKSRSGAGACVATLVFAGALVACTRDGKLADLSAISVQAASNRSEEVDPALCPDGGDGHVYFALGTVVVRLDPKRVVDPVSGIPVGSESLVIPPPGMRGPWGMIAREFDPDVLDSLPLDPEAPEGCYGHPIPVQHLILTNYQDEILGKKGGTFNERPLTSIRMHRSPRAQDRWYESLLQADGQRSRCVSIGGGVLECAASKMSETTPMIWTFPLETYAAPQGRPFIAQCGFGPGIYNDVCRVEYELDKEVTARYEFERKKVTARDLMVFDRSLRQGMAKMIVPDYSWTAPPAD